MLYCSALCILLSDEQLQLIFSVGAS